MRVSQSFSRRGRCPHRPQEYYATCPVRTPAKATETFGRGFLLNDKVAVPAASRRSGSDRPRRRSDPIQQPSNNRPSPLLSAASIQALAGQHFDWYRSIRRHIHAHPELSFEEHDTAAFVAARLDELGIPYMAGLGGTGIVATLDSGSAGPTIALRCELDALPILELNETAYKSTRPGVMHACGHDVHTACVLGAARVLKAALDADAGAWAGCVHLIFQPGEEKHPGGASLLLADSRFTMLNIDAIYALHVYPHLPAGTVGFRPGQYMASADEVYIAIRGKGGHAALPHTTIDPIAIAAEVIVALQTVISRKAPPTVPTVLSFGRIAGGQVGNVIPDEVLIEGTFRAMDERWRAEAHGHIARIAAGIAEAHGATAEVRIPKGYPSLLNDETLTAQASALAEEMLGAENVRRLDLRMTADDFAAYSQRMRGCFFRLGTNCNNEALTASVHNARFDIEEDAMQTGVAVLAWLAINGGR